MKKMTLIQGKKNWMGVCKTLGVCAVCFWVIIFFTGNAYAEMLLVVTLSQKSKKFIKIDKKKYLLSEHMVVSDRHGRAVPYWEIPDNALVDIEYEYVKNKQMELHKIKVLDRDYLPISVDYDDFDLNNTGPIGNNGYRWSYDGDDKGKGKK